jgi:FlgD Ig-like domain
MIRNEKRWLPILILAGFLIPTFALAQETEVAFHWAPSPVMSLEGDALSPATNYQVWLILDEGAPEMVATVRDTIYALTVEAGLVHRLCVRGIDAAGRLSPMSELSAPVYVELDDTRGGALPPLATLRPNYPNPFNPETRIVYGIPSDVADGTPIRLEIFNLAGKRVRTMQTDNTPGWHEVVWNGTDDAGQPAATGMYVTRFACGTLVETRKMTMLK